MASARTSSPLKELSVSRIDRYLLSKTTVPFAATVAVAAMLLLLERMLRLFDFVINENGPVEIVWEMLAHLVPHYLGMALPIGLFLGTALAFRSLSLSSELDAMLATGLGLPRLSRPIIALAILLCGVDAWLVGLQQPESREVYRELSFELRSGALGASIGVGEFVSLTDDLTLRVGGSRQGGRELTDIFIRREAPNGDTITATARRGAFFATGDEQTVLLRLFEGRLVDFEVGSTKPRVLTFAAHDVVVDLPVVEAERPLVGLEREMTFPELFHALENGETGPADVAETQAYVGAVHWRLVHILTLLVVPLFAAPLGIADKRTGSAGGLIAGLTLLIVYNEFVEAGERSVALGDVSPWLGLWSVFALFALAGVSLFLSTVMRPGRGVAGMIDRAAEFLIWPIRRLLRLLQGARA